MIPTAACMGLTINTLPYIPPGPQARRASGQWKNFKLQLIHKMNQDHLGAAWHGRWLNNTRSRIRVTHRIIERTRTHNHVSTAKGQGKAVGAPGCRSVEVLSINVIVRAVTGALEAQAVQAVGVGTAEVHATLVQRNPERAILGLDNALSS